MEKHFDGTIVTLTGNENYGCIIQRWALQQFLEKNSYYFNSYYFDSYYFSSYFWYIWFMQTVLSPFFLIKLPLRFIRRSLFTKKKPYWVFSPRPLKQLKYTTKFVKHRIRQEDFHFWNADKYNCYIVGSDQVWRDWSNKSYNRRYYWLSFVKNLGAKRISYAASFGKDTLEGANLDGNKVGDTRELAKKFNAISVRENTGINLVKEAWGMDAKQVIDPTLLLNGTDYSYLIENSTCALEETSAIFYYILDFSEEKLGIIEAVAAQRNQKFAGISLYSTEILSPVEQWLKGFRDAEFIVTDSFHGTVFAIINHTPFITFTNEHRGITRITSLLSSLGLMDRILDGKKLKEFDYENYGEIDWNDVEAKLDILRKESGDWLLEQLKK